MPRALVGPALVGLGVLAAARGVTAEPEFGPHDVPTVFFVSKSDDRNRVDYSMRLDADCAPAGKAPVFPYWREFEDPPPVRTHPLGWLEHLAYGVSEQRLLHRTPAGAELSLRLKAIPRELVIATEKAADGSCRAVAHTNLAGIADAQLVSAHLQLRRALSIEYLDIFGRRPVTGQPVVERVKD